MAMRWRWPPENSCGYFCMKRGARPTIAHELGDTRPATSRGRADPVDEQRLGERGEDRQPRIERGVGILEDHLQVAAARPAPRPREAAVRFRPFEHDRAGGGGHELQDGPRERRLAAAGLADQPEHLAAARRRGVTPSTAFTVPTCRLRRKPR